MKKICFILFLMLLINTGLYSQTIQINVLNELDFGEIVEGDSKEILKTNSNAAKYTVISDKKRHVYIDLLLPSDFISGANTVPVTFDAAHTGWSMTNNPATSTSFNPHQTLHVQVTQKNAPIYIWLGGTLTSSFETESGPYTGDITVKVILNP
jgi:hypothetical protein